MNQTLERRLSAIEERATPEFTDLIDIWRQRVAEKHGQEIKRDDESLEIGDELARSVDEYDDV